jgi:uncharacterized membrane protein (UPF0136 family)
VALAAAVGLVIGSIGPWVSVLGLTESGLDKDGVITLPCALGAIAGLIHHDRKGTRGGLIAALVLGALSTLITIIDYFDVQGEDVQGVDLASVEWGLYLAVFASIALLVTSLMLFLRHRREGDTAASPPPAA